MIDFKTDKYKESSPRFIEWLMQQSGRDDIIGDVANDTKRAIEANLIPVTAGFEIIGKYIQDNLEIHHFFIQHTDKSPAKKQAKVEKKIGHKLNPSYVNSISPLYCLQIAWDEYESFIGRKKYIFKIKHKPRKNGFVYFIGLKEQKDYVKIGYSGDANFIRRQRSIETACPFTTFLIGFIQSENYVSLEKELHQQLSDSREKREWFTIPYADVCKIILEHNGTIELETATDSEFHQSEPLA